MILMMSEKSKRYTLLGVITLLALPFFVAVSLPKQWGLDSTNIKSISLYLSSVTGYIGLSLLIWQVVLGTRSISGLFFANLPSTLKLHRQIGTYGIAIFALHPILVLFAYSESILYIFLPSLRTEYEQAVTYGRLAFMGILLIWLSSAVLRSKIAYRPW